MNETQLKFQLDSFESTIIEQKIQAITNGKYHACSLKCVNLSPTICVNIYSHASFKTKDDEEEGSQEGPPPQNQPSQEDQPIELIPTLVEVEVQHKMYNPANKNLVFEKRELIEVTTLCPEKSDYIPQLMIALEGVVNRLKK